jgi:hypothetical protein
MQGPEAVLRGDMVPKLNAVMRDLKREQCSLWSCANSILEDERFVAEIR